MSPCAPRRTESCVSSETASRTLQIRMRDGTCLRARGGPRKGDDFRKAIVECTRALALNCVNVSLVELLSFPFL